MKIKFLIVFIFLTTTLVSAQIKGIVKDSLTNQPIPFVNIWVENENNGSTSEENGEYVIKTEPKNQTLIFSALGFQTKKVLVNQSNEVVLKPIVYQLDEVAVIQLKKTQEKEVGDSKNRFFLPENQTCPWIFARKIQIDTTNQDIKYIKTLIFYTKSESEGTIFRARVFKVDEKGNPTEDLISEELIITTKKGRNKTIVDVSKFKIEVPSEGIIVGFESLLTENNKYVQEISSFNSKENINSINYGPHILYCYSNSEDSFTYRMGRWIKQRFEMFSDSKGKIKRVMCPAINVMLTN